MYYVDEEIRNDKNLMREFIGNNGNNLKYVSK